MILMAVADPYAVTAAFQAGLEALMEYLSGPAINLLAIILTARVLGLELGVARAVSAVVMAVVIGLVMAAIFQKSESCQAGINEMKSDTLLPEDNPDQAESSRPKYLTPLFMAILVAVLLVATSSAIDLLPKTAILAGLVIAAAFMLKRYYLPEEREAFFSETAWLARKIIPLLVAGTFVTGIIGYYLPVELIRTPFGSNSFLA